MNITFTRFAAHVRTWLLIAGLTALLVGIGALIGGPSLYLFAGLAVLFNVTGYWFSDRIAFRFSRARPVGRGRRAARLDRAAGDDHHRADRGLAAPARRVAPA
jgi:heat shock protein HtpX